MDKIAFPYEAPKQLALDLWELRGHWTNKFGRRMTIIRLSDGRLVIHNAIKMHKEDLDWVRSLGDVAFILAPNTFHCSDAAWMCERFPNADLLVPKAKIKFFQKLGFKPLNINLEFPKTYAQELKFIPMKGSRMEEVALIHFPSKTLILCDLAFNMGDVFTGIEKIIMDWNKVGGQFGPSRLTKILFSYDKELLLQSYKKLLEHDFDRVIVNHGEVLETGGIEKLRSGIARIFGARSD